MASFAKKLVCAALLLPGRIPVLGRPFREAARCVAGTYKDRRFLGGLWPWPWISPRAEYRVRGTVRFGRGVFIDDHCVVYAPEPDCRLELGDRVSLYRGTMIHLGPGGEVVMGADTHVQNGVVFTAFGRISIGCDVQIAPHCAFYPYDHGFDDRERPIREQPLTTKGGITLEDDVWLGVGVTVLDGVTIGRGTVVGAGAVVTRSLPRFVIAAGNPARVLRTRGGGEDRSSWT